MGCCSKCHHPLSVDILEVFHSNTDYEGDSELGDYFSDDEEEHQVADLGDYFSDDEDEKDDIPSHQSTQSEENFWTHTFTPNSEEKLRLAQAAFADWEQALTIDPQLASAWHNRGSALAMIGNYEEALNSYDRALEITPNDHQIINARGSALYGLQRWQEALECWQQVLEADDNFYQAWYNRGSTLENLGETQAAIACYQKALGIVPDFELAQTRLEALLGQKPPEDDGNPPA